MFPIRRIIVLSIACACILSIAPHLAHPRAAANTGYTTYLPVLADYNTAWVSPFGFETSRNALTDPDVNMQGQQLGASWVRLNIVSWRAVQPTADADYDWSVLAAFEQDVRAAVGAGLTPIVVVDDYPRWATVHPISCSAIRTEHFADFAAFMESLVQRYKQPPFNIRYWELGNEVDIDPALVGFTDNHFGCWGDSDDPYYGGEHYGNMLKAVTPTIKRADPTAQVLNGGLLLAYPPSVEASATEGHPARFLEGMLRAGAAPHFDILAYHAHAGYNGTPGDYGGTQARDWAEYGGLIKGKPKYLREVMRTYNVSKPLFFNEMSLGCPEYAADLCTNPDAAFFEAQADYMAHAMIRSLSVDVRGIIWYTLDGPGWRSGSLLDAEQQPRPVYTAYQHLITRLWDVEAPPATVDYGAGIEAYRFNKGTHVVDALWSIDEQSRTVSLPQAKLLRAFDRDGAPIQGQPAGEDVRVDVEFSVIYIERLP